mgnify:CR=1 FL=1
MKLTILGTGNAVVTRCYNTCFIFDDNGKYFLVDGGGGNGILHQLEDANIPWKEIRDIFITHKHLDHLTGIIWMIRMICQNMKRGTYEGRSQPLRSRRSPPDGTRYRLYGPAAKRSRLHG